MFIRILFLLVSSLMFIYCNPNSKATEESKQKELMSVSSDILKCFKGGDYMQLCEYIHPIKGIRFSPYSNLEDKTDMVFSIVEYKALFEDLSKEILWGYTDGRGDPIEYTLHDYIQNYVYNADYLNAEQVGFNKYVGTGNTTFDIEEKFPDADFIEYHFSGFDEKYMGMDWTSLRLVFEVHENKNYVVAVIKDQWTI